MTFLERTLYLLEINGVTKNKLLLDLNLGKNSFVNWESRGTIPTGETISKIADYFQVSSDYLLGRTDDPNQMQGASITPEEQNLLHIFRSLDETGREKIGEYIGDLAKLYFNVEYFPGGHAATVGDSISPKSITKAKNMKEE